MPRMARFDTYHTGERELWLLLPLRAAFQGRTHCCTHVPTLFHPHNLLNDQYHLTTSWCQRPGQALSDQLLLSPSFFPF